MGLVDGKERDPVEMLANTRNVDGSTSANRSLPEDLPVRRIGLEQEFFLVDHRGALRDLADPFLWRCQEAARAKGLDPHCFKPVSKRIRQDGAVWQLQLLLLWERRFN